jgi:hypothetical protein
MTTTDSVASAVPADPTDQALARHVRPSGWVNPRAAARYDLVVLGGGTAGLVSAMGAAGLGARVALWKAIPGRRLSQQRLRAVEGTGLVGLRDRRAERPLRS